jgi:hypothetical protein
MIKTIKVDFDNYDRLQTATLNGTTLPTRFFDLGKFDGAVAIESISVTTYSRQENDRWLDFLLYNNKETNILEHVTQILLSKFVIKSSIKLDSLFISEKQYLTLAVNSGYFPNVLIEIDYDPLDFVGEI